MTRVGQIGVGVWGSCVLKTLATMPDVQIVWTAGRHDWPTKLQSNAEKTDAVVICVPPDAQPIIAKTVLEMGLSVFLEKPLALSLLDARRIHEAAAMRGLPVVVNHTRLFDARWERLKEIARECGPVGAIEAFSGGNGPKRNWPIAHPGLWDWASHDLAMVIDLTNDTPKSVEAFELKPECYRLVLRFGEVAEIVTGSGFESRQPRSFRVQFGHETYGFDESVPGPIGNIPPLTKALTVWLDAVRGHGYDERVGTTLALNVVGLLEQAQEMLIV